MTPRPLLATALATLVLAACGGGGGDDDSPADDAVRAPAISSAGVSSAGPIGDLFGRATIEFVSNTGSGESFRIVASFGPGNLTSAVTVVDERASGSATLGGETMRETLALACTYVDATSQHLCAAPSGDLVLASLFDRPRSGRADGVFVTCPASGTSDACARRLVLSPAGPATLSVDRAAATLAAAEARSRADTDTDLAPYLRYVAQGAGPAAPLAGIDAAAVSDALGRLAAR